MKILHLDEAPTQQLFYLRAAPRGGVESAMLPIQLGTAAGLPDDVDAVLFTSDLQGRCPAHDGSRELLGVALAQTIADLGYAGMWPTPDRVGVVLAGDLYSAEGADERGASGDVRDVWRAFSDRFAWVVGVEGNHDRFGSDGQKTRLLDRLPAALRGSPYPPRERIPIPAP